MRTPPRASGAAPRFPVLHARVTPAGTATLDGRAVTTDTADPETAVLAAAASIAGWYARQVRVHLTDPDGTLYRLVVHPHGPVYSDPTPRARCDRDHRKKAN